MVEWEFILNPGTDALVVEEPVGWSDSTLEITRDPRFHGVSIIFGSNQIGFVGEGADLIEAAYLQDGAEASVALNVRLKCDGVIEYEENFALDFNTYEKSCGDVCSVTIGFEQKGCFQMVGSNIQKPVDVDKDIAFDGVTALDDYSWLQKEITIPAVGIQLRDKATGDVDGHTKILTDDPDWVCGACINATWSGWIMPPLPEIKFSSLGSFVTSADWEHIRYYGANNIPPYQWVTTVNTDELNANITCALRSTVVSFRMKGNVVITATDWDGSFLLRLKLFRLPAGLDETNPNNWIALYSQDAVNVSQSGGSGGTFPYDLSSSFSVSLAQGDKITFGFFYTIVRYNEVNAITLNQDASPVIEPINFFDLQSIAECEDSTAKVYLVHELMSRITEAMSNKCVKLESSYYGRTDSEPDAYQQDGCGGLRALTTGLYIRKAENPTFTKSMYDLLEGLSAIDNVGFCLFRNAQNEDILKVEDVGYFYQDAEILRLTAVASTRLKPNPEECYGMVVSGYEKWQPLQVNGLDEFNSTREHRLKLNNSKAKLEILSNLVASGYAIETTRQQGFANTGAADTGYDNDTFIICMTRTAYDIVVEQGGITDAENMADPDTVLNFRISPLRNLMRWFKSIIGSYRQVNESTTEIEFVTGSGNFKAKGYYDDSCAVEKVPIGYESAPYENMNLSGSAIKSLLDKTALFRPEIDTFEYPLSLKDFKTIQANPYGYISYQCGNGEWRKGFIRKISFKIGGGTSIFELRTKFE